MPSAIAIIKRDHAAVKADYRKYKATKNDDARKKIAKGIFDALDAHAKMENEVFYPALEAEGSEKLKKQMTEAREEHREMEEMVSRFRAPNDEEREGMGMRIDELIAGVLHHAGEEEREMLPAALKSLGQERMLELGEIMEPMSPTHKAKKR